MQIPQALIDQFDLIIETQGDRPVYPDGGGAGELADYDEAVADHNEAIAEQTERLTSEWNLWRREMIGNTPD